MGGISKRSRNTTPVSTASTEHSQNLTASAVLPSSTMSYLDILDKCTRGSSPPPSGTIKKIGASLKCHSDLTRNRSETCDKGMREISRKRKYVVEQAREQERADREVEETRKERIKQQGKSKKERDADDRPLAVGAHSMARQDGLDIQGMCLAFHNDTAYIIQA